MSSSVATWTLTCWTRVRIGLIGKAFTDAMATEW